MTQQELDSIKRVFDSYAEIKLAYLFGSRATGRVGPLSDYDFAVYFDEKMPSLKMFDLKLRLMAEIDSFLKRDDTDVVMLNSEGNPVLRYHAIKYGQLIFERDSHRMVVEPRILSAYFDFKTKISTHNLARVK
jgi:predicted nucleotidyltransferase